MQVKKQLGIDLQQKLALQCLDSVLIQIFPFSVFKIAFLALLGNNYQTYEIQLVILIAIFGFQNGFIGFVLNQSYGHFKATCCRDNCKNHLVLNLLLFKEKRRN